MFDSDGARTHYTITGAGRPLVLLHGWANRYEEMWVENGWVDKLSPIRTVIGVDQRGHGKSDKPHDPEAYSTAVMAGDIVRLLNHLEIEKADVFGYSMGGGVTVRLLAAAPERVSVAVMGGVGSNVVSRLASTSTTSDRETALLQEQAAVDGEDHAGDVAGLVGR